MTIESEEVLRIAKAVAMRYKRRCWWADVDDLVSEASVAVLTAHKTFDPQVGVSFAGYATKAAILRVRGFLWRESSPLSGGLHDPRKNIAGVHAAPLDDNLLERTPNARDQMELIEWRHRVRDRIRVLADRTRDGDLAVEVMVHERPPGEIIQETGRRAYSAVSLVRRKVRSDAPLYKLWRQGARR